MSFFKRFRKQPELAEPETPVAPVVTSKAKGFVPPPPRPTPPASADPKVASLEQRRQSIENAIELVQRSADPDSPYQQRISILNTTLDSIEADIRAATPFEPRELPELPPTPIDDISVTLDPVPDVRFSVGPTPFEYAEEIDWAERGTQIVRGDLLPVMADVEPLIPASISGPIRAELTAHLDRSLFAYATDLRDRAIEGRAQPTDVTLADLAKPCTKCGDWELWGGVCLRCLEHETKLRELNEERTRLLDDRSSELEERQKQVEELPIQRRRLAETNAELQNLRP